MGPMLPEAPVDIDDLAGDDPYRALARARAVGPATATASGFALVVGHAACLDVLRSPLARSGPISAGYHATLPPGAAHDEMVHRINFLDPPDHPRVRGLVARAFTPRRIDGVRPFAEATAEALADGLDDRFDLLTDYAHHLPSLVISELLGVPAEDRDRLTRWSDEVTPLLGWRVPPEAKDAAIAAAEAFHGYLGELLDERADRPTDDLLSALLAAEDEGERLSRPELLSLAATLYSAGHRTTRDLTTNGLSVLLTDGRDRWEALVADPTVVGPTVAEVLRYETPTLFVARVPAEDLPVGSATIPAGTPTLVALAGANRDPAAYPDPDRFDPDRWSAQPTPPPALSFAFGAHHCLGASLARMEVEVLLATAARRWPGLRVAPGAELTWRQRGPFRSLAALPVTTT